MKPFMKWDQLPEQCKCYAAEQFLRYLRWEAREIGGMPEDFEPVINPAELQNLCIWDDHLRLVAC